MSSHRVCRAFRSSWRILLERIEDLGNRTIQLRVPAVDHQRWIVQDFDIRVNAIVFHSPHTVDVVEREGRHRQPAAVNQRRTSRIADQSTPGARTDQWPEARGTEVVGECIATLTAPRIDQHHFRTDL